MLQTEDRTALLNAQITETMTNSINATEEFDLVPFNEDGAHPSSIFVTSVTFSSLFSQRIPKKKGSGAPCYSLQDFFVLPKPRALFLPFPPDPSS